MTETVVPSGTERSKLGRARDYKPDRNTRNKERHRDGDCSRARETHHRQFPALPQPSYHQRLSTSPPFSFTPICAIQMSRAIPKAALRLAERIDLVFRS